MAWFIKHETFTPQTAELSLDQRRPHLEAHRAWVEQQGAAGRRIRSGFLVDEQQRPGGGGTRPTCPICRQLITRVVRVWDV